MQAARKAILADTISGIALILAMIPPAFFYVEFQLILAAASPVVLAWVINEVGYFGIKNKNTLLVKIWLGYNMILMYYTMIIGAIVPFFMFISNIDRCETHRHEPICDETLRLFIPLLALIYFFITYIFRVVLLFMGSKLQLPITESSIAEASADHPSWIDLFEKPNLLLQYFKLPWATQFEVLVIFNLVLLSCWAWGCLMYSGARFSHHFSFVGVFHMLFALIVLLGPSLLALVGSTYRQPSALIVYVVYCLTPLPFLSVALSTVGLDRLFLPAGVAFMPLTCIMLYKALRLYHLLRFKPTSADYVAGCD